jgi:diaminohydroxyphosphoribosylaminopyrimidine deaminase/5-amino-6-(5-phosphoribosylamino)uracil reductase
MQNHEFFMQKCLDLAKKGIGAVSPNPMVGSIIVYNGEIIGEGYHQEYGSHHAEVNAINSVKDKSLLKKSTLYVNLEPCAHFGKTPPCSNLIIENKIPKVVIGCIDTFSEVSGKGIEISQGSKEVFLPAEKVISLGEIPLAGKLTNLVEKKVASTFDGEKAVDQSLGKYEVGFSGDVSFDSYNRSRIVKDNVEWNKGVDKRNVGTEAARWFSTHVLHTSDEKALEFANKVSIVGYSLDKLGVTPMIPRKTAQVLGKLFENKSAGRVIETSASHPKPPERVVWIP